jgi:hypothetical protein
MPDVLAEYQSYVASLTPTHKAEFDAMFASELAKVKAGLWQPDPRNGPQCAAYYSQADLLLFGGAAGAGKTSLVIGLACTQHQRSVIFRSKAVDMRGVEEELLNIMGRDGWNGQEKIFRRGKRVIELGHLEKPGSEKGWQGRPHDLICVGRGTKVLMADQSFRPIEELKVGNLVETLEGPRRISKTFPSRWKQTVKISANGVSQIQGSTHRLLTSEGWVCHGKFFSFPPFSAFSSKEFPFLHKGALSCVPTYGRLFYNLGDFWFRLKQIAAQWLILPLSVHPFGWEIFAYAGQEYEENDSSRIGGSIQLSPLPLLLNAPQAQQLAGLLSDGAEHIASHSCAACDVCDVPKRSSLRDYLARYLFGIHLYGEHIREAQDRETVREGGRLYLHRSAGVGRPIPKSSAMDAQDRIPRYSRHIRVYDHPYRKEKRSIAAGEAMLSPWSVAPSGVREVFDIQVEDVNHYITEGGFVNSNCFDEGAQLARAKVQFVLGWLRSTDPQQRRRAIIASNPPTGGEGEWLMEWFAPWLDPKFPNPALPGELRWCATAPNREGTTIWLPDNRPIIFVNAKDHRYATVEEIEANGRDVIVPKTRTFIPGHLDDNPYLRDTGYRAQLQALPEPLRSQLLHGDFLAGREDHEWQVIPTSWVKDAQLRWTERPPDNALMSAMGVDVAQGGADQTVIAPRHGWWYAPLIVKDGAETPNPSDVAALVIMTRRNKAAIVLDIGGGYGGGVRERLEENQIDVRAYLGGEGSGQRALGSDMPFKNKRAESYWRFREALDPDQLNGAKIALPPDALLLADLTAVRWDKRAAQRGEIQIEDKEELKKPERLGRSPDRGDAVVMAWAEGEKAIISALKKANRNQIPIAKKPPGIDMRTERGTGWMAGGR